MASVVFDNASRLYHGAEKPAVNQLNLTVDDGECVVLVGPSGCGKSTSLRMVAGLEPVTSGRILIGDTDMTGVRPRARDVAMVFQSYALYPNMTVEQNMAFALENQKLPKNDIRERVKWAAKMLQLEDLLTRKPHALSGGQRQRVAMGRAIVRKPTVFCMDEPLSNLDAKLRVSMRSEIAALQRKLAVTTIYVTHDQVEAMTMGHRVAVMRDGELQQADTPQNLYAKPVNTFVAQFIGSPAITLFECAIDADGYARLGDVRVPIERGMLGVGAGAAAGVAGVGAAAGAGAAGAGAAGAAGAASGLAGEAGASGAGVGEATSARRQSSTPTLSATNTVIVGVRPESWHPVSAGEPGLELVTTLVEILGSQSFAYGEPAADIAVVGDEKRVAVQLPRGLVVEPGEKIRFAPNPQEVYLFDAVTGQALGW